MKFHLGLFLMPKLSYSFCILLVQTCQGKTYKFTNLPHKRLSVAATENCLSTVQCKAQLIFIIKGKRATRHP